ncbi:hypothetical protein JCM12298_00390 [Desulfothermus naphthae]
MTRESIIKSALAHVDDAKLPKSQNTITETLSWARYLQKLIPAESIAETITPDKIKLFEEIPPLEVEERYTTTRRVISPKTNAKKGTL